MKNVVYHKTRTNWTNVIVVSVINVNDKLEVFWTNVIAPTHSEQIRTTGEAAGYPLQIKALQLRTALISDANQGAGRQTDMRHRKRGYQIIVTINVNPIPDILDQKLHTAKTAGKLIPRTVVLHDPLLINKTVLSR